MIQKDPVLHHIVAANEGNAAAIAAGYHLATGKIPVVYMQNSGEGNIVNPAVSLLHEKVYRALAGKSYKLLEKKTFGAKKLVKQLREIGNGADTEMELVGLCTDICVLSNALVLKAFLPETPIAVDAACCAGVGPESHRNALRAMETCQVRVLGDTGAEGAVSS